MYHLYHTKSFVMRSADFGEANSHLTLFTRELGLIKASAQAIRTSYSKLRPGLLDFSYSLVTLVRGRNVWRVTSAIALENVFQELRGEKEMYDIFARSFLLLGRLLQGEEKNESLFDHVFSAYTFARNKLCKASQSANFEYILVLRMLHSLGYVGSAPGIAELIATPYWNEDVLRQMGEVKTVALTEINRSLKATQL